jgi:hypothetical protein
VSKRLLLLPLLLAVSALALTACGSGGNSGSSGDREEGQVKTAIETAATSTNPINCAKFSTQTFMEQGSEQTGQVAVKACEKEASQPNQKAKAVTVSKVEVHGSRATADAAVTGSGFGGQTLVLSLVKEGGQWKVNRITGFAKLDRAALLSTFETELEAPSSGVSKPETECIVKKLGEASQAEIEQLLLSGSTAPFVSLAKTCA